MQSVFLIMGVVACVFAYLQTCGMPPPFPCPPLSNPLVVIIKCSSVIHCSCFVCHRYSFSITHIPTDRHRPMYHSTYYCYDTIIFLYNVESSWNIPDQPIATTPKGHSLIIITLVYLWTPTHFFQHLFRHALVVCSGNIWLSFHLQIPWTSYCRHYVSLAWIFKCVNFWLRWARTQCLVPTQPRKSHVFCLLS